MICRFCSQWNPSPERRCIFCNNLLQATEDATIQGVRASSSTWPPSVLKQQSGELLAGQVPRSPDQPSRIGQELAWAQKVWQGLIALGVLFVLLLYFLGQC